MDRGNGPSTLHQRFRVDVMRAKQKQPHLSNLCSSLRQLGRTERLKNTSSPSFSQRLRVDYHFETVQNLKLGVYDIDNSTSDLGDDDYLGGVELTLGQVLVKHDQF